MTYLPMKNFIFLHKNREPNRLFHIKIMKSLFYKERYKHKQIINPLTLRYEPLDGYGLYIYIFASLKRCTIERTKNPSNLVIAETKLLLFSFSL